MPSVDELLNAAEVAESTLTETNDKIEIDADTRTMMIPETENVNVLLQDGIHPNNLGAKKIASVVVNEMKSHAPIN